MRMSRLAVLLLLVLGLSNLRTYGQVVATWTDSSGNWSNAASWSTNPAVPNNGEGTTYSVTISPTTSSVVTMDLLSDTIDNLTVGATDTLNIGGGNILNLVSGSSLNNGTINVTDSGGLNLSGQFLNLGVVDVNHGSLTGSLQNSTGPGASPRGMLVIENGSTATLTALGSYDNGSGTVIVSTSSTLSVPSLNNYTSSLEISGGSVVTSGAMDNTKGYLLIDHSTLNLASYSSEYSDDVVVQDGGTLNVSGNYKSPLGATSITGKSVSNILGTLSLGQGSTFTLDDSVLNLDGDVAANEGGTVVLRNNSIGVVGGSATIYDGNATIDQSILTVRGDVSTFYSDLTMENGATLNVLGNFNNGAQGVLMMSGTGDVLNVQGLFTNAGSLTVGSLETLNANGGFTNSGGNVSISSGGSLSTSNYSQSSGLTDVSGNLTSHSYSQSGGNTTVETGGVLSATTFTATGGTVTVDGTLDPTAVEIGPGAALQGTGVISGNVAMGGTIMPGLPGTPGTLTIVGDYEQIDGGVLDELIGQSSYGLLDVTGDVALDSDSLLQIAISDGYNPLGQTFDIMDYNSLVGQFSNGSSFWDDGYLWDVSYGQNEIGVTAVSTPEPSSVFLLAIGLAALALYALRKVDKTRRLV
jgi:PEP-CTERM motif-containing protein